MNVLAYFQVLLFVYLQGGFSQLVAGSSLKFLFLEAIAKGPGLDLLFQSRLAAATSKKRGVRTCVLSTAAWQRGRRE